MYQSEVTIIFCSCDAFSDLWGNFFYLFSKYWPEFDGKIILNTEKKCFSYEGLDISQPLNCEINTPWEDRLKMALKRVETPYVLIFLEDYYLKGRVDDERYRMTLNHMKRHPDVKAITYLTEPGGTRKTDLNGFQKRKHFAEYKVTGHITLWDKEYLKSILRKGETAWQFEVNGTIRSWLKTGTFYCKDKDSDPVFPYDWGLLVNRGRYLAPILQYFQNVEGLKFEDNREIIQEIPKGSSGNITKKLAYLLNGICSIFKA